MRVLTWNILHFKAKHGSYIPWPERAALIRAAIRRTGADIVALQEVDFATVRRDFGSMPEYELVFMDDAAIRQVIERRTSRIPRHLLCAILVDKRQWSVVARAGDFRHLTVTLAPAAGDGTPVRVANVHLKPYRRRNFVDQDGMHDITLYQTALAEAHERELAVCGAMDILLGDLNDPYGTGLLGRRGMVPVSHGCTHTCSNGELLDYIAYHPARFASARAVEQQRSGYFSAACPSDHRPLVCELVAQTG